VVGDDVVDLRDPAIATHHLRDRFLDRVLAPGERAALVAARSPKALLWAYFAAKEAAYKIVAKQTPSPVFAHRLFVVGDDLRSVRHEGRVFALDVRIDDDRGCVHAVASIGSTPTLSGDEPFRGLSMIAAEEDASVEARALLCRAMAPRLGCAVDELSVVRRPRPQSWDGFEPPRLHRGGVPLPIDVSLSHDGRFVSFAARLA
jgi:phosphopantetheinyl transferase (holo-ACP synthase)